MKESAAQVRVRRMSEADLDQVMGIAAELKDAPHWPRAGYVAALGWTRHRGELPWLRIRYSLRG